MLSILRRRSPPSLARWSTFATTSTTTNIAAPGVPVAPRNVSCPGKVLSSTYGHSRFCTASPDRLLAIGGAVRHMAGDGVALRPSPALSPDVLHVRQDRPKTALFFPGQGNQKPGMISSLARAFPQTLNPLIELLDHTIYTSDAKHNHTPQSPEPLSKIIQNGPASLLTSTGNAQPAILFTSLAILEVLKNEFGLDISRNVDYYLGHSLGEFTALVTAGIMKMEDSLHIVRRRGVCMAEEAKRAGKDNNVSDGRDVASGVDELGMFAVVSPAEHLTDLISTITTILSAPPDLAVIPQDKIVQIANHNSSTQIVLSGHVSGILTVLNHVRKFSGHDPRAIKLNVSAPFHSRLMMPAVRVVGRLLDQVDLNWQGRKGEVVSNVTAEMFGSEEELKELLSKQAVERVRWWHSIKYLENEKGVQRWIGTGPGVKVGRGLVGREVKGRLIMVGEGMEGKEFEEVVRSIEEREFVGDGS